MTRIIKLTQKILIDILKLPYLHSGRQGTYWHHQGLGDELGLGVGVADGEGVGLGDGEGLGVGEAVGEDVELGVGVGVGDKVGVGLGLGEELGVDVAVGVGEGAIPQPTASQAFILPYVQ